MPSTAGSNPLAKYSASTPANESGFSSRIALADCSASSSVNVRPLIRVDGSPTKRIATSRTPNEPHERDTRAAYHHPSVGRPFGPSMAYSSCVFCDALNETRSCSRYRPARASSTRPTGLSAAVTRRYCFTTVSPPSSVRRNSTDIPSSEMLASQSFCSS